MRYFALVSAAAFACGCSDTADDAGFDVASVLDGGSGGSDGATPGATGAPPASSVDGAACLPPLARCDGPGASCCEGSICLARGGVVRCVETCEERFDCGSLCCVMDEGTKRKVCGASDACPPLECSDVGGSCSQPGPECCSGLACVASSSAAFSGCRKPCQAPDGCETGCCVPYADGSLGFCAESSACQCGGRGDGCGGVRHCCEGFACSTFDASGTFACQPRCSTGADCSTGCCVAVDGTSDSVCLTQDWCGPSRVP